MYDFRRRSGYECFICGHQIINCQAYDLHLVSQIAGNLDYRKPGDAQQNGILFIVGHDGIPMDQEDVFRGGLGQVTLCIQEDRFVVTLVFGFADRQNRIDILSRSLGRGRHHIAMELLAPGDTDPKTSFARVTTVQRSPWPCQNAEVNRTILRVYPQITTAPEAKRPNVATGEPVGAHQFCNSFGQFL